MSKIIICIQIVVRSLSKNQVAQKTNNLPFLGGAYKMILRVCYKDLKQFLKRIKRAVYNMVVIVVDLMLIQNIVQNVFDMNKQDFTQK